MINHIYQLITPKVISVKYDDISLSDKVIVRPEYMALCHADQRYYQGQRDAKVLRKKLPMALIHECCGKVVFDPKGKFSPGELVVLIPNTPTMDDNVIYENYRKGSYFLSSGYDGFMRELVEIDHDRVVSCGDVDSVVAAIAEFVSVAIHAVNRFDCIAHEYRSSVGIWGDGSLSFTVANVIKALFPDMKIVVIGQQQRKLSQFSFVDETYFSDDLPKDFCVDHAFECCGGEGCYSAIEDVISHINPQGTLILMGVSENKVPINTRMILEKGLTFVGCSRSGRSDFETAVSLMRIENFQQRMKTIIYEAKPVNRIEDIHRIFSEDMLIPFKTVFKWNI